MYHPSQQLEILVVTTSPLHANLHTALLTVARRVAAVGDAQQLMRRLWERNPDLLVLVAGPAERVDVVLVCAAIRTYYQTPILVLEQGAAEEQRIRWLDAGADDVLSWQAGIPGDLAARCRALVQRARRQQRRDPTAHCLHALGMQLDIAGRRLQLPSGQCVALTDNLTRFLAICFVHSEAVVLLETLGLHIYGRHPSSLRKRLAALAQTLAERTAAASGPRPSLEPVRNIGYRLTLVAPQPAEAAPANALDTRQ